ncbi:hypothetical protein FACS1894211_15380 [Clostridia bacterium]|nr:hypothetical protein FACS1894211_15380 [Clostridia bacterium]
MSHNREQRIKIRLLYDLLARHTDENNPLSTEDIIALLKKQGITVESRTLLKDIQLLNEYGYEIKSFKKKSYYFYVEDRAFDIPELRILIDAVQAAGFIPDDKTESLVGKIAALAGDHRAEVLRRNAVCFDTAKHANRHVFYIIDALISAIERRKKASFLYYDFDLDKNKVYRKNGERYTVNPLALIYTNDKYYLTCYSDKYKDLCNYRIDRMERVETETADITPVAAYENFNIHSYKRQAFSMFTGELKEVTLTVSNDCIDAILDKFGENVPIVKLNDLSNPLTTAALQSAPATAQNSHAVQPTDLSVSVSNAKPVPVGPLYFRVTVPVQISPTFYAWCLTSCGKIRITAPADAVQGFAEYRERILTASAE